MLILFLLILFKRFKMQIFYAANMLIIMPFELIDQNEKVKIDKFLNN